MAFNAGAIIGKAKIDTTSWKTGLASMAKGTAVAMAAIVAAVGVAMVKAVKSANEFQKAMSNINTIVDETVVNTQDLAIALLKLDPALGNTTELTQGMYQAFSAGAETAAEAMEITTQAAMFAKAGLTDTFTAVDVITTAMNAYGKENMSAAEASDLLFNTIKRGKVTGAELAGSLGKSIPLFASVGVGMDELTAGLASMTKVGINANIATTQLNAMVNGFIKPSEAMTAALEKQGYTSGIAFLEAEGLAGALELLKGETEGNEDAIAKLIPNVRGMRGVMALARQGGEEFTKVLAEQQDVMGVTEEAFKEQEKTFDTFKNTMSQIQIVIGNVGKHFIDKIAVGAIAAGMGVRDFLLSNQGMEVIAQILGNIAAAWTGVKEVIKLLFETVLPPFKIIWDSITDAFKDHTTETKEGLGALNLLAGVFKAVAIAGQIFGKIIALNITAISDFITLTKDAFIAVDLLARVMSKEVTLADVREQFEKVGGSIKDMAVNYFDGTVDLVTSTVDSFKNFGGEVRTEALVIQQAIIESNATVSNYIRDNWQEIVSGQTDFTEDLLELINSLPEGSADANDDLEGDTKETLYNMEAGWQDYFSTVSDGMGSMVTGLGEIFQMASDQEIELLENQFDTESSMRSAQVEAEQITQEEADILEEAARVRNLAKLNEAKKKAFDTNKKFNIADTIMTGASAIMGWWKAATSLGPIAGPIFAGIMTAATGALVGTKTALIGRQQFIPAKAEGGMASGLTRINEEGGEIVILPDQSLVVPHDLSRQIAGNSGQSTNNINVSFKGAIINNEMDLKRIVREVSTQLGRELRSA